MRTSSAGSNLLLQINMERSFRAVSKAQEQIASGRRINTFSDAPADAVAAARMRAEEQVRLTHTRSADDGFSLLSAQDEALQQVGNLLNRVRELTIAGANDVATDATRIAQANEIEEIRDELVALANTTFDGRSVFAGFSTQAVSSAGGVVSLVGDDGAIMRRISPELEVKVNVHAADAFGFRSGDSVFTVLNRISSNIRSGSVEALSDDDLATLQSRQDDVRVALGEVGAKANQLDRSRASESAAVEELRTERSRLEDADLAEAALELSSAQTGYQAAIAAAARLQTASLLDFLR